MRGDDENEKLYLINLSAFWEFRCEINKRKFYAKKVYHAWIEMPVFIGCV